MPFPWGVNPGSQVRIQLPCLPRTPKAAKTISHDRLHPEGWLADVAHSHAASVPIAVSERLFLLRVPPSTSAGFLRGSRTSSSSEISPRLSVNITGTPGPVARVIHAAIIHHEAPRAELRGICEERGNWKCRSWSTFSASGLPRSLTPLLRLLTSSTGMINVLGTLPQMAGTRRSRDFEWRLQEFSPARLGSSSRPRPCRLRFFVLAGEHVDPRNGTGQEFGKMIPHVDRSRAAARHHTFQAPVKSRTS